MHMENKTMKYANEEAFTNNKSHSCDSINYSFQRNSMKALSINPKNVLS